MDVNLVARFVHAAGYVGQGAAPRQRTPSPSTTLPPPEARHLRRGQPRDARFELRQPHSIASGFDGLIRTITASTMPVRGAPLALSKKTSLQLLSSHHCWSTSPSRRRPIGEWTPSTSILTEFSC